MSRRKINEAITTDKIANGGTRTERLASVSKPAKPSKITKKTQPAQKYRH